MFTQTMAMIRERLGLPANAPIAQVNAALEADINAAEPQADAGADAGAEEAAEASETAAEGNTEAQASEATPEAITAETVQSMIDAANAAHQQAVADLNETIANLSARLATVEGSDADEHTGGKTEAADLTNTEPLFRQNPINQRAAARLAGNK